MADIILSTLNARFIHSSFGLRYLYANLGGLQAQTQIQEFTIQQRPLDIAEQLLQAQPKIIGMGMYIWNAREVTETVALLKTIAPEVKIVLGGPEISYETEQQPVYEYADHVITGSADLAFAQLCEQLLAGEAPPKLQHAGFVLPQSINMPYAAYSDADIANRVIYVEASRGCPFRCEFCLSALDKTAYPFDLDLFLQEMEILWQRGVRHFKFVDRTFNLKIDYSIRILEFFLERMDAETFLHFELIPDHLPERLKAVIQRFPAGSLQFEIGVQTFNTDTQQLISRRQDNQKTAENLVFLRDETHAHIHADLIAGLPGEDLASFAQSFNRLWSLRPHEIQLGILKRLRGSPIIRHTEAWDMRYSPLPPYALLSNRLIPFEEMQRMNRFARYWDMVGNSGRFSNTLPLLLAEQPFENFMHFADWLHESSQQTHKIALEKLFDYVFEALRDIFNLPEESIKSSLMLDFQQNSLRKVPQCLLEHAAELTKKVKNKALPNRQAQHLQNQE